jgi:hypothetical protein
MPASKRGLNSIRSIMVSRAEIGTTDPYAAGTSKRRSPSRERYRAREMRTPTGTSVQPVGWNSTLSARSLENRALIIETHVNAPLKDRVIGSFIQIVNHRGNAVEATERGLAWSPRDWPHRSRSGVQSRPPRALPFPVGSAPPPWWRGREEEIKSRAKAERPRGRRSGRHCSVPRREK